MKIRELLCVRLTIDIIVFIILWGFMGDKREIGMKATSIKSIEPAIA